MSINPQIMVWKHILAPEGVHKDATTNDMRTGMLLTWAPKGSKINGVL